MEIIEVKEIQRYRDGGTIEYEDAIGRLYYLHWLDKKVYNQYPERHQGKVKEFIKELNVTLVPVSQFTPSLVPLNVKLLLFRADHAFNYWNSFDGGHQKGIAYGINLVREWIKADPTCYTGACKYKYLIEDKRKQHGTWLCLGEMLDTSQLQRHENFRWTDDANYALQWNTFEEAESHRKKYWDMPDIEVTPHEFS